MSERLFTLAQVRAAFWEVFHESGEQWFNYLDSPEVNAQSTEAGWNDFWEALEACE